MVADWVLVVTVLPLKLLLADMAVVIYGIEGRVEFGLPLRRVETVIVSSMN